MENKDKVHEILAQSYFFYFVFLLIGVGLDYVFPMQIFQNSIADSVGMILMIIATLLILWAQKTSRSLNKENLNKRTFMSGPYKYTRSPTHWGLSMLIFSFGITINAFFIVVTTVLSFFLTKMIFLKREEKILTRKYGEPYKEYKKTVRL